MNENASALVQQLECSICLQILQVPKLLQCGHSFCQRCIEMLIPPANRINVRMNEESGSERETTTDDEDNDANNDHDVTPPSTPIFNSAFPSHRQLEERLRNLRSRRSALSSAILNIPPPLYVDTIISCPECRKNTKVGAGGLPTNYKVCQLLQAFNGKLPVNNRKKCHCCHKAADYENLFHCETCSQKYEPLKSNMFCATCVVKHHKSDSVISLSDMEGRREELLTRITINVASAMDTKKLIEAQMSTFFEHLLGVYKQAYENLEGRIDVMKSTAETLTVKDTVVVSKAEEEAVLAAVQRDKQRFLEICQIIKAFSEETERNIQTVSARIKNQQ